MLNHRLDKIRLVFLCSLLFVVSCSQSAVKDSATDSAAAPGGAAASYHPPSRTPGTLDPSANKFTLTMLNGGGAKLTDLIGKDRVVLVNFWATWCGPCRREIPDLTALRKQFDPKQVEIIGLTVEEPELKETVQAFTQQFAINYTIGFSPKDLFFLFNQANGSDPRAPIPQTFIFGRDGKLIDSAKGLRRDFRTWAEGAIGYALKNS